MKLSMMLLFGLAAFAAGSLASTAEDVRLVTGGEAGSQTPRAGAGFLHVSESGREIPDPAGTPWTGSEHVEGSTGDAGGDGSGGAPGWQLHESASAHPDAGGAGLSASRARGASASLRAAGGQLGGALQRQSAAGGEATTQHPVADSTPFLRGSSRVLGGIAGTETAEARGKDTDPVVEWYRFEATVGDLCRIFAEPEAKSTTALDFAMTLYDPSGALCAVGAENTLGHSCRLLFKATRAGTYQLSVAPREQTMAGSYTLHVDIGADEGPAASDVVLEGGTPVQIPLGEEARGELSEFDARLQFRGDDRGTADEYTLYLKAADRISIECLSSTFDAYLFVLSPTGEVLRMRDGGFDEGNDARADLTAKSDGLYRIVVSSYQPTGQGAYRLAVRALAD